MTATISGETQVIFATSIADALPQAQAKRVRPLGVTSLKRSAIAPDVPTLNESGLPGYEFTSWHVFAAPAATPRAIVNQLSEKLRATITTPDGVQRWRERGIEVVASTPDEGVAFLKKEAQKWRVVFKDRGIKMD